MYHRPVLKPDDEALDVLGATLAAEAETLEIEGRWPAEQMASLAEAGVYRWFLPPAWGGYGWSEADLARGYLRLSAACLTTTFILTQRSSACQRIAACENEALKHRLLPGLADGSLMATVGISHLTTSRRHVGPVLVARPRGDGYELDGYSPWVTGAAAADYVVVGAQLDDGRQLLAAVSTKLPGLEVEPPARLVALAASQTGRVAFRNVTVKREWLVAVPTVDVMNSGVGARTGGLQTSALALGLADAAITYLEREAAARSGMIEAARALRREQTSLSAELLRLAQTPEPSAAQTLRQRSNEFVLRATHASLAAAKGAGFVAGHPAGRWCREALFFLVWSCPQPVVDANLCQFAGLL